MTGEREGREGEKISLNQKNVIIFLAEIVVLRRELMIHTKSVVMKDHEILGPGLSKDRRILRWRLVNFHQQYSKVVGSLRLYV